MKNTADFAWEHKAKFLWNWACVQIQWINQSTSP